ncbi:hypothetical protein ACXPWS_07650 [Mycobacterium sp. BMJ-28]
MPAGQVTETTKAITADAALELSAKLSALDAMPMLDAEQRDLWHELSAARAAKSSGMSPRKAGEMSDVADYFGLAPSVIVGDFEIPNPALLDDDQQDRWEALQFDLERCDTDDDGDLLTPYRIDGEPLAPSYSTRLGQVVFGDDYEAAKAAGVSGNRISLEWARMAKEKRITEW